MNAKDLCVIENLKEMYEAGICSFKVEGRTKSVHYAALIAKIYRKAIDDVKAGVKFDPQLLAELDKVTRIVATIKVLWLGKLAIMIRRIHILYQETIHKNLQG